MSEKDAWIGFYRDHIASAEKYIYWIMASAGAGIALSINTDAKAMSWDQTLLLLAIILWSCSFWAGILTLREMRAIIYLTSRGMRTEFSKSKPDFRKIVLDKVVESHEKKSHRFASWQLYCFALGAMLYLVWRIIYVICSQIQATL
jgi:hypothetical protein